MPQTYSKQDIRKYLALYHHLTDAGPLPPESITEYIRAVGCIQYDPLDVVGRNPDLVLQVRCRDYKKGDIERELYVNRTLFDVWDKNMSICSITDWPFFYRYRQGYLHWCDEHKEIIEAITVYLREHECACSSDFDFDEKVGWHYGPQRLAKAALECMCYAGLAIVHHKKGTRRYYCLADEFVNRTYFEQEAPYNTEDEYYKMSTLRRINGVGIMWNRPGDVWDRGFKRDEREKAFRGLLDDGRITELLLEACRYPLYIAASNLPLLQKAVRAGYQDHSVRILAPLDNMLWDRALVNELFGFEYKWEVYTPIPQRKYGYYVLPVFLNAEFIGRIEMATDNRKKELLVKNFWAEDGLPANSYMDEIINGLDQFKTYNLCSSFKILCDL